MNATMPPPLPCRLTLALVLATAASGCDEGDLRHADEFREACGPAARAANPDGDGNTQTQWTDFVCNYQAGERLVGFVNQEYSDAWDTLDGIAAVCERLDGSLVTVQPTGDFSNAAGAQEIVVCPADTTVVGLRYPDAPAVGGVPADLVDAVEITCSDGSRPAVEDLLDAEPMGAPVACPEGQIAVGMSYIHRDDVTSYSDLVDAVTLVCADDCASDGGSCSPAE